MAGRIETAVEEIAAQIIASEPGDSPIGSAEIFDVEYVKERDWYLRVYIDSAAGVDLDLCQAFSRRLEAELDKISLLNDSYILEVSSPGIDRVLKKDRDFEREAGKIVDVTFYSPLDGKKTVVGKLIGLEGDRVLLEDGQAFPRDKVAQVRLHIDF